MYDDDELSSMLGAKAPAKDEDHGAKIKSKTLTDIKVPDKVTMFIEILKYVFFFARCYHVYVCIHIFVLCACVCM